MSEETLTLLNAIMHSQFETPITQLREEIIRLREDVQALKSFIETNCIQTSANTMRVPTTVPQQHNVRNAETVINEALWEDAIYIIEILKEPGFAKLRVRTESIVANYLPIILE